MAKSKAIVAPVFKRLKAFIMDMFLIAMPLLYICTYLVLDGKEDFQNSPVAVALVWLIYGVVTSLFCANSAQTPGYKSQGIYLISLKTGRKISFFHAFLRFLAFVVAGFSLVGICICLFRKDGLNLHDIITQTSPVVRKS